MVVNSMSYATYERYKESGVDWLGEIPSDWELISLNRVSKVKSISNHPNERLLSVYLEKGVIPFEDVSEKRTNGTSDNLDKYQLVDIGDFVLNNQQAWRGSVGVSNYRGIISPAYIILEISDKLNSKFANYFFRSEKMIYQYVIHSKGVGTIQRNLYWQSFKNSLCWIPSLEEQTKIANFLDQKTAQIDQAISLKQQQIEKLNEYKQIVIQNAVTKGLNPNAPMKNSGVEWIGNIPEHWDVKKLKYLTSKIGSGITPSGGATTYVDKGIPLLRSQNIHFDGLVLDNVANISLNVHKSMKNSQVKQHDVLLNITGGSLGRCCYNSSNDEMNVNQHVCIVRPNNLIKGEFLNGLMSSEVGQKQIWFFQQGGGREGLNFQNLKNFDFPLPSIDEQKEIIAHIESLKQHFKKSVDNYQTQIDRLKEYKNILINQAVTGKIKI